MKIQNVKEMKEHLRIISKYILSEGTMYSYEQVNSSLRALGTSIDILMEEVKIEEVDQKDLNGFLDEWEKLNEIEDPSLLNLTD